MTVTETICDQCGARKGKENGWWKIELGTNNSYLTISKFESKNIPGRDICSQNCAMMTLDEFLNPKRKPEIEEIMDQIEEIIPK